MTFAAARVAYGTTARRELEFGGPIPVMESYEETGSTVNETARTITAPAGIVEDDVLLCHVVVDGSGIAGTLTAPSDTTPWVEMTQGGTPNLNLFTGLWYKVVTAVAEPANYQWTFNTAEVWGISVARFSGVDTVNPITDAGNGFSISRRNNAIGGNFDDEAPMGPINCTRTNCLLYHAFGADNNFSLAGITPSSADGEVNMFAHKHSGTAGVWHGNSHEDFPSGGGTGTRIWTMQDAAPGAEERATHLIGLQPPIGTPFFLELEGSADHVLFEDGSGSLLLE